MIRKILLLTTSLYASHATFADTCPDPNTIAVDSQSQHFVAPWTAPHWVSLDPVESRIISHFSIHFRGAIGSFFQEQYPTLVSCEYLFESANDKVTYTIELTPIDGSGLEYSITLPSGNWKLNPPKLSCSAQLLNDCPIVRTQTQKHTF